TAPVRSARPLRLCRAPAGRCRRRWRIAPALGGRRQPPFGDALTPGTRPAVPGRSAPGEPPGRGRSPSRHRDLLVPPAIPDRGERRAREIFLKRGSTPVSSSEVYVTN